MPQVLTNVSLASHTTLGVGGSAEYFTEARTLEELRASVRFARERTLAIHILGGGSNVLIPDSGVRGLVIRPVFTDIAYTSTDVGVEVTAGAGVVLDVLIEELVGAQLWGLENLSAIPGTVGGVPVQNVGAYGVEARDVISSVTVYDPEHDVVRTLDTEACQFGYRDSYFKHGGAHLIILSVTFRVSRNPQPRLSYKDLTNHFGPEGTDDIAAIRHAVIAIRSKKFPDWRHTGTAGSFFKNPIIPTTQYESLRLQYPDLPGFVVDDGRTKVSLGWILDHVCGLRGYHEDGVGLYEAQALVLVCERETNAARVIAFAEQVIAQVYAKTGITVEREVTMFV